MAYTDPIPCMDCGAPGPSQADMDTIDGPSVAVHDCEEMEWLVYRINIELAQTFLEE